MPKHECRVDDCPCKTYMKGDKSMNRDDWYNVVMLYDTAQFAGNLFLFFLWVAMLK